MNFLAHCALGRSHPHYLVGSYLGDFVKGSVPSDLPALIQVGIRLHRRIDAFSAVQPDIKDSVLRLPPATRRLAPVFVDLVADHFLALHFRTLYGEPLEQFTSHAYRTLSDHEVLLPTSAARFMRFAREHDVFGSYVSTGPVERAFGRICARLGRDDDVAACMQTFVREYDAFDADFRRYYPALRTHAELWLRDADSPNAR